MIELLAVVALQILVPILIIRAGVYYGMRQFTKWDEKRKEKSYEKIMDSAKKRKR